MAERRIGGKPRREENNKTSGSVNERKRQTHSRKYDVTGGEKQIKTGSKGKNVQGKPRQAHSSQYKPNPNSKCPISHLCGGCQYVDMPYEQQLAEKQKPDKIRKLVDIQANVAAGKGIGYERWAKKFNLKRWSQTLCLLQEKKLLSEDALNQRIVELKTQHDDALAVVKDLDARMVSLKELRGHLVVYRQYKPLAQKLQTVRNPAAFREQHRAELAVYEAACAYFKANGLRTLPDLKKLDAEYQTLSSEKNGFYTRYKKAQIELRELRTAQQNVEAFFRKEECSHAVPQQEVK